MPRAKRGFKRRRRANKTLDRAEGFVLGRCTEFRRAAEAVNRALSYAYRDRRRKKRTFRSLWITRISAATRISGLSYSEFFGALSKNEIRLNRKMLSEIAIHDPAGFDALVQSVAKDAPRPTSTSAA